MNPVPNPLHDLSLSRKGEGRPLSDWSEQDVIQFLQGLSLKKKYDRIVNDGGINGTVLQELAHIRAESASDAFQCAEKLGFSSGDAMKMIAAVDGLVARKTRISAPPKRKKVKVAKRAPGAEYKSKKGAGGDVSRAGAFEPYAYMSMLRLHKYLM